MRPHRAADAAPLAVACSTLVLSVLTSPPSSRDPPMRRKSSWTGRLRLEALERRDTPTLGSPVVIRDLPPEAEDGDTNHNGGAIHFGVDGKLYAAVGDHNYDTTPQSADVSQILTTPFGKMLRLNPDGTNPSDNPFF